MKILCIGEYPKCVKQAVLHSLMMMVTATDIVSKNRMVSYFVNSSTLLESLFWLLSQTETRLEFGYDCLVMIALLVNFEKDRPNTCAVRLSLVDDHVTLNGYSQVEIIQFCLYSCLRRLCLNFRQLLLACLNFVLNIIPCWKIPRGGYTQSLRWLVPFLRRMKTGRTKIYRACLIID